MTALDHVRRALAAYDEGERTVRRDLLAAVALLEGQAPAEDEEPTRPGTPSAKSSAHFKAVGAILGKRT